MAAVLSDADRLDVLCNVAESAYFWDHSSDCSAPKGYGAGFGACLVIPEDTPYFYWLIPESPTRGALGMIGESAPIHGGNLEKFLEKRKLEPVEFQGARIPAYSGWTPCGGNSAREMYTWWETRRVR